MVHFQGGHLASGGLWEGLKGGERKDAAETTLDTRSRHRRMLRLRRKRGHEKQQKKHATAVRLGSPTEYAQKRGTNKERKNRAVESPGGGSVDPRNKFREFRGRWLGGGCQKGERMTI